MKMTITIIIITRLQVLVRQFRFYPPSLNQNLLPCWSACSRDQTPLCGRSCGGSMTRWWHQQACHRRGPMEAEPTAPPRCGRCQQPTGGRAPHTGVGRRRKDDSTVRNSPHRTACDPEVTCSSPRPDEWTLTLKKLQYVTIYEQHSRRKIKCIYK